MTDQAPQQGKLILYHIADDAVRSTSPRPSGSGHRHMAKLFGVDVSYPFIA